MCAFNQGRVRIGQEMCLLDLFVIQVLYSVCYLLYDFVIFNLQDIVNLIMCQICVKCVPNISF